ncbi:mitotic fidelity of chromosome transmission-related protein [Exophiala xenobiotica]|uniref:CENP-C homolog n=1 Tax=Vermiconidia calcicola TaxID=1690605 RepID=A0AAV9QDP9_9PEZI|nr:mitotic fidelity of chromosome transmission-related protein [Exophiala xenobiotica]KAK5430898.1 mitotic fidelity of chromosome transmission-related protein [Exophiala xenobiotica]KAK5540287.1 mitotic fidelity of chromosome transmission-related protein [Chaetothyriales sp. CCFEE 6169]KAK5541265.1 mitotic fidelity of chromosome transmission-related protein [Vermiconidia calcicola]
MAPRASVRVGREDVNYSAVGKLGRRTGVALEQRPLDANGMEEITGIFSSPRKPSPLKNMTVMESVEEAESALTPTQALSSSRRSTRATPLRPPRSSSPRKSGISGTARRSQNVDIFSTRKSLQPENPEDRENTPTVTSSRLVRQFTPTPSPEKSPLRDITMNGGYTNGRARRSMVEIERSASAGAPSIEEDEQDTYAEAVQEALGTSHVNEAYSPVMGDEEDVAGFDNDDRGPSEQLGSPSKQFDDEEVDRTFEPEPSVGPVVHNQANSRKKRKSDVLEHDEEAALSPVPQKARNTQSKQPKPATEPSHVAQEQLSSKAKGKQPLRNKDANIKMSSRQQKELDDIIEKVKARPGPPRSLYILHRETPADDTVTHTRSGRISIKPLAYWRNERCVYGGGSPSSGGLADGARFPLNSIKEVVRTEEVEPSVPKKVKKRKTGRGKSKSRARTTSAEDSDSSDSNWDMDDAPKEDTYAEPWETGSGTLRGSVSIWDPIEQAPLVEEEEIEIAHAPAAIKTREVKGSSLHEGPTFRYAKLLSTKYFGTGLVDLPPGGIKRPKNSRKMHMSFFVVKGRVTVSVGPMGADETGSMNRFSIGKGGYWQVPRGNQYSIENELDKPARIFFSQGCETSSAADEE